VLLAALLLPAAAPVAYGKRPGFEPLQASPTITSLNPTSGIVGTPATITGTSFGASQGSSTVTFNGTAATPTSWSDTSIVAPVPGNATSGNVVVTVSGVASNGKPFLPSVYGNQRTITIDHTKVGTSDSAGFPLLFSGTYSYLATVGNGGKVTNANGYDIVFTTDAACSTQIPWEIESYDPVAGKVNIWINVATLSHTADTLIYMCYGNPAISTSQGNAQGVWDSNFSAVYHFTNGAALGLADSTGNNNNLTNSGATAGTGQIGGAIATNGSQYANKSSASGLPGGAVTRTVEAWIKPASTSGNEAFGYGANSATADRFSLYLAGSALYAECQGVSASIPFTSDGGWHHLVLELPSGNTVNSIKMYLDGVLETATYSGGTTVLNTSTANITVGSIPGALGAANWTGSVDEARISKIARSADWITAEYNNQKSPSTFSTIGVSTTPTITGLSPWSGAAGASVTIIGFNFGAAQGASTVTFNGSSSATVSGWGDTSVTVSVPSDATTGNLAITVGGVATNGKPFTVIPPNPVPRLTSISPASAYAGAAAFTLTLTGSSFIATSQVQWNGSNRTTTYVNATQLTAAITASDIAMAGTASATVVNPAPVGGTSSGSAFTISPVVYGFQRSITIDHTKAGSQSSTSFPMLFSGTYSFLATTGNGGNVSNANGYDIIFTTDSACSNKVPAWEMESYDPVAGRVNFWINIASLSNTADTVIYLCYGSPVVTTFQSNAQAVWDANFSAVYHFTNGAALGLADSTGNHNNLTNFGAAAATGQIGGAIHTNIGQLARATSPTGLPTGAAIRTVEAWFTNTSTLGAIFGYGPNNTGQVGRFMLFVNGSTVGAAVDGNGSASALVAYTPDSLWHHVVAELPSGNTDNAIQVYLDGTPRTVTYSNGTSVLNTLTAEITVGELPGFTSQDPLMGSVDEARISTTARSADWILAEYNNQKSPSTFYTVGGPFISGLSPLSGAIFAPVTISGSGFGSAQGGSTVTFHGTAATPTSWADGAIGVAVPVGTTTGNVVVTVNNVPSNGATFTMTELPPTMSFLTPASGPLLAPVTITGTNFSSTPANNIVTFNGIAATVLSSSATSISTKVPAGATDGNVVVTVGGLVSGGVPFTVTPGIVSLSPSSSAVGVTSPLTLVVTGSGFISTSQVMWNNSGRATTYVSATTLNAAITTSDLSVAGTFLVSVQTSGGGASGSLPFGVGLSSIPSKEYIRLGNRVIAIENPPAITPSISSVTSPDGPVGSSVMIAGANFESAQGMHGTVTFNGIAATVSAWNDTSITVTAPVGATTGNVLVTTNSNLTSNGVNFTVTP